MLREFAISSYLFIFKIIFILFKLLPQQEKITCVASFGDNINHIAQSAYSLTDQKIIILKSKSCRVNFEDSRNQVLQFETLNMIGFIQSIYHLATSKVIFVDNYFGFLSVTKFKASVTCIQVWHAAGAIKQFGLMDPSVKTRSSQANDRFIKVYNRFTYVIVGSEKMSAIFRKSFGLSNQQILRTGIPRTDFFFDKVKTANIKVQLQEEIPIVTNKKVILYAPTFRDSQLNDQKIMLDIKKMYAQLSKDHVLLLRLHPAVKGTFINQYPEFVIDVSKYQNINHLLVITDLLITDYSSIPFEFALLEKPMIFFTYDFDEYTQNRGFWEDYQTQLPGPIVTSTTDLINTIKQNQFNIEKVKSFSQQWNQYSRGNSSKNIIEFLYKTTEQQEASK
ncbi:CDP-glycerol glycerophosphotransferase family protein [Paraliobacillus sediminis]|uniref:CDP-glycerol glycerophosphotransferase family protein n=1 Tax=Paraliobacillus sediminis TaxID=1885916 RepID=UPI000E3CB492|nr:CDP-glycerol glycerophosphotransferase family protein [Paraliobacillus sediminis]